MEKKQLTLVVVSLLVVVLSVSVAYFTAQIIGEGKKVSVTSANLQIIFKDEDGAISSTDIEPGWTSTKTFTVKNSTKSEYKYNIVLKDLVNTFVTEGYLQYKITSTNSGYNMTEFKDVPKSSTATDTILAYNVSVPVGTTQTYTVEFKYSNDENVDQSKDMGKKLSGTLFITEGGYKTITYVNETFGKKLLSDKTIRPGERTDFSTVLSSNNTKTLYCSNEDNTQVYYFAGNATDNWVKFGKVKSYTCKYNGNQVKVAELNIFNNIVGATEITSKSYCETDKICVTSSYGPLVGVTESQCTSSSGSWISSSPTIEEKLNDIYWRIIRTNADGSIRLLYHGTSHSSTTAHIGFSGFDNTSSNTTDGGYYMYGDSENTLDDIRVNSKNSVIKSFIDSWFIENLTSYKKYLSETAVYCNDRNVIEGTYSTNKQTLFSAYTRLVTNKIPTYNCENNNDRFTVSVSTGNGKLDYPIALMTADEVAFAGGVYNIQAGAYFAKNSVGSNSSIVWHTISPSSNNFYSHNYLIEDNGTIDANSDEGVPMSISPAVRPVTSLKSCVKYASGDGSATNPYTIAETDSGC